MKSLMLRTTALTLSAAIAASCAQKPAGPDYELADAFRGKGPRSVAEDVALGEEQEQAGTQIRRGPRAAPGAGDELAGADLNFRVIERAPAQGRFENLPIPVFVDAVFNELLGLSVEVDEGVINRQENVTLRIGRNMEPEALFETAAAVLRQYGINVVRLTDDGVRITTDDILLSSTPQFIRGRSGPGVQDGLRPVFQIYPVANTRRGDLANWIARGVGSRATVTPLGQTPAILISGPAQDVAEALRIARFFDQPDFADRRSMAIEPAYWSASAFATELQSLMTTEGYEVGIGPGTGRGIVLSPVSAINTVFVFAATDEALDRVEAWARELDRPSSVSPLQRTFVYFVKNTTASDLGSIVQEVLSGQGRRRDDGDRQPTVSGAAQSAGVGAGAGRSGDRGDAGRGGGVRAANLGELGRLVIDNERNALIFAGEAQNYERVRELLEQLDRSPREVLIEVVVAQITLTDSASVSVNITQILRQAGFTANLITGGGGLSATVLNRDAPNAFVGSTESTLISALASNDRVSIISKPNLIVRSGENANIASTTDVPQITGQSDNAAGGTTTSVSTRSAGVILDIEPIVYSKDRIDVIINQEVSSQSGTSEVVNNPIFTTQSVSTSLSLRDGQTAYIGGLIQRQNSRNISGVPVLKDIPLLGHAFRSQGATLDRSELVLFITAYVIDTAERSENLAVSYQERFERFENEGLGFQWW